MMNKEIYSINTLLEHHLMYGVIALTTSLLVIGCQLDPSPYEPDVGPMDQAGVMTTGGMTTAGVSAGNTAGSTGGTVAGDSAGERAGEQAGDIAGESAGDVAGDIAGESAGDAAGELGGDVGGDVAGELAGEQAGAVAGESAGEAAGEVAGMEMAPERCSVQVSVSLPANTPSSDTIYMASDVFTPQWQPNDEQGALIREGDLARGVILLPNFTNVAYKFTRGDWDRVEVNQDCSERANRFSFIRCAAGEELTIEEEVTTWRGVGACP